LELLKARHAAGLIHGIPISISSTAAKVVLSVSEDQTKPSFAFYHNMWLRWNSTTSINSTEVFSSLETIALQLIQQNPARPTPTMQFTLSSTFIALAVFTTTVSAGGFAGSCRDINLVNSGSNLQIEAVCNNNSGGDDGNQVLFLSDCVGNNNGHLQCQSKCAPHSC
jgi:hypothetical protein